MGFLIAVVVTGLIVGGLARLALPGPDPMSIGQTMLIGIGGSLIAAVIVRIIFGPRVGPGLLFSVLCATGLVYAVRRSREQRV